MKTLKQAVETCGLKSSAELLGVSSQRLSNWMDRGVPVEYCATVEVKLGVARRDLRPDDWHLIWPELADSQPNQPQAPAHQARVAINSEAMEATHG